MSTTYRIHGLNLRTDQAISGLCASQHPGARVDLILNFAAKPAWVVQALALPPTSSRVRPDCVLPGETSFSITEFAGGFSMLTYGDGTRFLVDETVSKVWGEPGAGLSHDDLCVYLLGPVMGFILRKRGLHPLHASAIAIQGSAIALVGEAGAGKSTTAAALALRGWPVLCEDVCAFADTDGEFSVLPAYPRVSLWPDSVEFLFSSASALPLIVPGWEKRFLALDGTTAKFSSASAPLAAVFLLANRSTEESAPRIEPITAKDALLGLVQDTYMNWLLDGRQRAAEFDLLGRLVSATPCFRLTPSANPARLPALAEIIETHTLRLLAPDAYPSLGPSAPNV